MKTKALYNFAILPLAFFALRSADVEPLTKEFKSQTVEALASAMNEQYVFPELAKKIDADLKSQLAKGEFASIEKGDEFAKLLTDNMNALTKDAHLRVLGSGGRR